MNEETTATATATMPYATEAEAATAAIKIDPDAFYHLSHAASLLGVSVGKLMVLNRAGKLPIKKDGKLRLIHGATITAWLLNYEGGGVIVPRKYEKSGIYAGKTPEEKKKVDRMLNEQKRLARE